MRDFQIGDRFIIEIGSVYHDAKDGSNKKYGIRGFNTMIMDSYALSKMKNADQVLKDYYKNGVEAGKKLVKADMFTEEDAIDRLAYSDWLMKIQRDEYQRGADDQFAKDCETIQRLSEDREAEYDKGYKAGLRQAFMTADRLAAAPSGDLKEIFGFDVPSLSPAEAIMEKFSPEEIVVKMLDYDRDKKLVKELADQIGIHKLYSIASEIRGE